MRRLSGIAVLFAAAAWLGGCSDNAAPPLAESADAFFSAIADGDMGRAHRHLSKDLAARTPTDALAAFVRHTGLEHPGETRWQSSTITGNSGVIDGEIKINGEPQPVPVRLSLLKQDINWKIDGLARGVRVVAPDGEQVLYAPAENESSRLARQTMARFADAVQHNELERYWSAMAAAFRQRFSAQQFDQAFAGFVRDQVNLGAAAKLAPRFTAPPTLESNGELVMRGVFPTRPSQTAFEYRYMFEGGTWINSGITLNLVPLG